jgi:hypothetical protein
MSESKKIKAILYNSLHKYTDLEQKYKILEDSYLDLSYEINKNHVSTINYINKTMFVTVLINFVYSIYLKFN